MIRWFSFFIGFFSGSFFGIMLMCLMIASKRACEQEQKEMEVMKDAGGDREQDSESGDQHVEADRTYYCLGGPDVPVPPEGQDGAENDVPADREADR